MNDIRKDYLFVLCMLAAFILFMVLVVTLVRTFGPDWDQQRRDAGWIEVEPDGWRMKTAGGWLYQAADRTTFVPGEWK